MVVEKSKVRVVFRSHALCSVAVSVLQEKKVVAEGHDSAVIAECWIPPYEELRAVTKRFKIQ